MHYVTECSVNHVLERSDQARRTTGKFLAELIKDQLLLLESHMKGLSSVLEIAEDLAIDIPNIWEYLAQLIAPTFVDAGTPLDKLKDLCDPLVDLGKSATLAAAILEECSHSMVGLKSRSVIFHNVSAFLYCNAGFTLFQGHIKLGQQWNSLGLKWSQFLSDNQDQDEFIKSNVRLISL